MPPLELVGDLLLRLVLPAMFVSGLVVTLGRWLLTERWQHVAVCGAVVLGMLAGNALRASLPYWPDDAGWPWLLAGGVVALCVSAALYSGLPQQPHWRAVLGVVVLAPLAWCLTPHELRTPQWLPGLAAVLVGNALALEFAAAAFKEQPGRGWLVPLSWASVLCGGAAAVVIYSHSARLADAAVLLASALMGVAAVGVRGSLDARSLAGPVALYLTALMLNGYHSSYSEVPPASFALVACAPLGLAILGLPAVRRWPAWSQALLLFVLPLLPVALAVALAIQAEGFALGI